MTTTDSAFTIDAIVNGRPRGAATYRELPPFRVADGGPDDLSFAVKCAHRRRAPQPIAEAVRVFESLGRADGSSGGWYGEEHLRWIAQSGARPIKRVRAEFAGAQRWLASAGEWLRGFGELDSAGQLIRRGQSTAYARGIPTMFIQAGQLAAYKATAVAHAILAGGHNVVIKTTTHEPLSAYLFARACLDRGLSVPQVVHLSADREENREALSRAISQCKQSVVFGEDRTITRLFRGQPWDADHRVAPFWTGRSGAIVLPDADLVLAAACLVRGMVSIGRGDDCASTKRVLVHERCASELGALLVREVEAMASGDPLDEATDCCPDERQREATLQFFEGAELLHSQGAVLGFMPANARVFSEELPYPMLALQRFGEQDDPAALADRHVAGTASGRAVSTAVFTQSEATFREVASRLSSDKVLWNQPTSSYDFKSQHSGHHLCLSMMRDRELVL